MSLQIEVGVLAGLEENDEEGLEYFLEQFSAINTVLRSAGLPEHTEPKHLEGHLIQEWDLHSYSSLHYLRRVAAYLAAGKGLPVPSEDRPSQDEVVQAYYSSAKSTPKEALPGLRGQRYQEQKPFQHLMNHSDGEGYYLPLDFEAVIFPDETLKIEGGQIGSSLRLLAECQHLATVLGLPLDLSPDADEVYMACKDYGKAEAGWQRYGVESLICLSLLQACQASITTGCAIVFV